MVDQWLSSLLRMPVGFDASPAGCLTADDAKWRTSLTSKVDLTGTEGLIYMKSHDTAFWWISDGIYYFFFFFFCTHTDRLILFLSTTVFIQESVSIFSVWRQAACWERFWWSVVVGFRGCLSFGPRKGVQWKWMQATSSCPWEKTWKNSQATQRGILFWSLYR